ncbi:MAG: trypsin-like peptidase domain-containing protein [Lachnospiraceae bacterium]|nr:trypsin-like peptidase domain-containing protein [Lachnospiraceae bacterium]
MDNYAYSNPNNFKKSSKKYLFLWISAALATMTVAVLFVIAFLLPVSVKETVVFYELGSEVSTALEDYVEGNALAMRLTQLDMSEVVDDEVGEYDITVKHGLQEETFSIVIQDTTAPEITFKQEEIYLKVGELYGPETFVDNTYDLSGEVEVKITLMAQGVAKGDRICCGSAGTRMVKVTARDIYGNETTYMVEALADTPPEITGYKEFYVAEGNDVVFSTENIMATDAVDGDLSGKLELDVSGIDLNNEGIYEVIYSATDRYGFSTEVAVPVHVLSAMEVQELINSHEINRFEQHIVGAYNLYDGGVFEEDNIEQVLEAMEPAIVVVTNSTGRGSGFIVKITDTDVVICTNLHVTDNRQDHTVFFHDGQSAHGVLVGSMDKIDVSFIKVSRDDIPQYLQDTLLTVHIDAGYLDSITDPRSVNVGFRTLETDGTIWQDKDGVLVELKEEFVYQAYGEDWLHGNLEYVTQVTAPSFHGASGSAIFDGHGNLIAMVSFYYYSSAADRRLYYGMTVEDILRGYRQIFGEDLNYQ